jgi:hypothetical protein
MLARADLEVKMLGKKAFLVFRGVSYVAWKGLRCHSYIMA